MSPTQAVSSVGTGSALVTDNPPFASCAPHGKTCRCVFQYFPCFGQVSSFKISRWRSEHCTGAVSRAQWFQLSVGWWSRVEMKRRVEGVQGASCCLLRAHDVRSPFASRQAVTDAFVQASDAVVAMLVRAPSSIAGLWA